MLDYFIINALMLLGLISISFLLYHTGREFFRRYPLVTKILFGIIAGVAGVLLMRQSFETSSGVLVGYRNYNIGIAALTGGFVPAAIAAVIMFFGRVMVVGFNQVTMTLAVTLTVITIGGSMIARYVKQFCYQWAGFCTLNLIMTSLALFSLLRNEKNIAGVMVYFYIGHILLYFILYVTLKIYNQFEEDYRKMTADAILNTHDPLTGLLNRIALRQQQEERDRQEEAGESRAVLVIDIDNFKIINEALSHREGDHIIVEFSRKILDRVADRGTVFHTDGDEFAIILNFADSDRVQRLAKELLNELSRQIRVENLNYYLTVSIGVCLGTMGQKLSESIKNAEAALYIAKKKKNSIVIYTKEMDRVMTREKILEEDIRLALEKGQLELYYQPIYDVRYYVINQAEVLLRWNHPEFGQISPAEFIPIAERTKMILPITEWVIKMSCLQLAQWHKSDMEDLLLSVNLSFISFENRSEELQENIVKSIRESGIKPSSLKLEITESTIMNESEQVIKVLNDLKSIGVKLALDDFGTGYSSFGYMNELPLDIIKLDRSLIADIVNSEKEQMIVNTMINIIHGLGLEVVVEGVEKSEQYEILREFGCDYIQGFLFSSPLPSDKFIKYCRYMKENEHPHYCKKASLPNVEVRFPWQPEWNSGNQLLDEQHKSLMETASRLAALSLQGVEALQMLPEIDKMIADLTEHFEYEAGLLREVEYIDFVSHQELHRKLLAMADDLREAFRRGEIKSWSFFTFLIDEFILDHLKEEDMKFYSWLKKN